MHIHILAVSITSIMAGGWVQRSPARCFIAVLTILPKTDRSFTLWLSRAPRIARDDIADGDYFHSDILPAEGAPKRLRRNRQDPLLPSGRRSASLPSKCPPRDCSIRLPPTNFADQERSFLFRHSEYLRRPLNFDCFYHDGWFDICSMSFVSANCEQRCRDNTCLVSTFLRLPHRSDHTSLKNAGILRFPRSWRS